MPLCLQAETFIIQNLKVEDSWELFNIAKRLQLDKLKYLTFGLLLEEYPRAVVTNKMKIEELMDTILDASLPSDQDAASNLELCAQAFRKVTGLNRCLHFAGERNGRMDICNRLQWRCR
jgi:hypothetical protein